MHGMTITVTPPSGESRRINITTASSTGAMIYDAANPSSEIIGIVRTSDGHGGVLGSPGADLVKIFQELASVGAMDGIEAVWHIIDNDPSNQFPSKTYRGNKDLASVSKTMIDNHPEGSCCIYDQYGVLDARVPASVFTIGYKEQGDPYAFCWDEKWLFERIMSFGNGVADSFARNWILSDMKAMLASMRDEFAFYDGGAESLLRNFDALSLHQLGMAMEAWELERASQLSACAENHSAYFGLFKNLSSQRPSTVNVAKEISSKIVTNKEIMQLHDKVIRLSVYATDIVTIWQHCLDTTSVPVTMVPNREEYEGVLFDVATTELIGKAIGVDAVLESYARGVPIEDILA